MVNDVALVFLDVLLQLLVLLGNALGVVDRLVAHASSLSLLAGSLFGLKGQLLQALLHLLAVALKVVVIRDFGRGIGRTARFVFRGDVVNDFNFKIIVELVYFDAVVDLICTCVHLHALL